MSSYRIHLNLIIYVKITTNTTETNNSKNATISSSEWQPGTVSIRSALSLDSSETFGKSIGSLEKMNQMRPDDRTLEELFQKTIATMDLPADKLKMLREFPPDKKWDIIRDRDQVIAKHPPQYYIDGLKTYIRGANLVPKASTLKKKQPIEPSTQLLSSLEISLRTNNIGWVHEFLNSYNKGLDVLLDYLITSLEVMREVDSSNDIAFLSNSNGNHHLLPISMLNNGSHNYVDENSTLKRSTLGRSDAKRLHRKIKKYQIGEATDDVRLCIMCLRAIMNNQNGFNLVIQHPAALNCITLSLQHKNYRCKSLILELLAAVCLVELGHDVVLAAFDNFRIVCQERHRFETLMKSFTQPLEFNVDYMIACMQFINIIVHSVQDMNYRVYLQEEFKLLGLDECLKKYLEIHSECDLFILQIHAFLDNYFDVGQLLEDSETKQQAITKVAELEEQLGITNERIQELESGNSSKLAELQKALSFAEEQVENVKKERDDISHTLNTLRRSQHDRELLLQGWMKPGRDDLAPNVALISRRFNEMCRLVITEILSQPTINGRIQCIEKWGTVADICRYLRNFNGVLQIMAAFVNSSIYRLKQTWDRISKQSKHVINKLQTLVHSDGKFKNLRDTLTKVDPPCIPYLGLYLSDLTFIEESSQDISEKKLINFSKMRMKTHIISEVRRFQSTPFKIKHNPRVCAYLLNPSRLLSEDQCYGLSLQLEPRASRAGVTNLGV
ncbi:unnamed protein product [Rotaria sp. Silwood1]|nr:unnamed protein product [Rotaria sp. Silwood1]